MWIFLFRESVAITGLCKKMENIFSKRGVRTPVNWTRYMRG